MGNPYVLEVTDLTMQYETDRGPVHAVDEVTFNLARGESLGLVGESGCGKSSIAISLMKLLPDNARILKGQVILNGVDLVPLSEADIRQYRWRNIAIIFQAAMNALNPVHTVEKQISEAIRQHMRELTEVQVHARVDDLLGMVGLDPKFKKQYPHEYSGGMRQRAMIAMALACDPDIIIADEPTTALDVIVQDAILKEMRALAQKLNMAMIYISHDIAVIAEVSDRVGVMYAGRLVELASTDAIFHEPLHPYTMALMSSFPSIAGEKTELIALSGEPPDLISPPTGCRFHPRCPFAGEVCRRQAPEFAKHSPDHLVACWYPGGRNEKE